MANTYTKLYIHIVFAVKYRQALIDRSWRDELYKYICGIVNGNKQKVYAIGGVADHIHILVSIHPNISISELVKDIKGCSSKWINEQQKSNTYFRWQEGFGAFSYAQSELDNVIRYINNQEAHHARQELREEYIHLLRTFDILFDEHFLFKDPE